MRAMKNEKCKMKNAGPFALFAFLCGYHSGGVE